MKFQQKEKRVVTYNLSLDKKQISEINRQVEKVIKLNSIKGIKKSEYGDSVKYVKLLKIKTMLDTI